MPKLIDIAGVRFGKLVIVKRAPDSKARSRRGFSRWVAKCDCGNKTNVSRESLARTTWTNPATSCGCIRIATFGKKRRCSMCREIKPLAQFYRTGRRQPKGDTFQSRCIACISIVKKKAYARSVGAR